MPRGKKQSNRPSAGGVVRRDYRRRNPKEKKSMHKHSFGRMHGEIDLDCLPRLNIDALIKEAVAETSRLKKIPHETVDIKEACVNYLRHKAAPYSQMLRATGRVRQSKGTEWLSVSEHLMAEIAEVYPWLADECQRQIEYRRGVASRTRVIKRAERQSLSVQFYNEQQAATTDQEIIEPYDEDNEIAIFQEAIGSLSAQRFLFFPPFLKRDEIRLRRFGGQLSMNDRWWEWERELNIEALEGRPNEFAA